MFTSWTQLMFFFLGILSFVTGIIFIFFPRFLLKTSEMANRIYELDSHILKYRVTISICLMATSCFLFLMAYYVHVGVQHQLFQIAS